MIPSTHHVDATHIDAVIRELLPNDPNAMTILQARNTGHGNPVMAKTWSSTPAGPVCKQYDNAFLYRERSVDVSTFPDFCTVLRALRQLPHACAIRGGRMPHADPDNLVRRVHDRDIEKATFEEIQRRWILFDMDHLECDDYPDPVNDTQNCIDAAYNSLPSDLHGVACFWSFSASTGMKPGKLGIHFWFLLESPLGWREAESFMKACGADVAMSRAVQPHFTASPVFIQPLTDPLPRRFGVIKGIDRIPADAITRLVAAGGLTSSLKAQQVMARVAPRKDATPSANYSIPIKQEAKAVAGMICDGQRHRHLLSLAGFARSRGLGTEELRIVLGTENNAHCFPPLPPNEVDRMADNYARYTTKTSNKDEWEMAISIAAGLIRHNACTETITKTTGCLMGNDNTAKLIVGKLSAMPIWKIDCAEIKPDLVFDRKALS